MTDTEGRLARKYMTAELSTAHITEEDAKLLAVDADTSLAAAEGRAVVNGPLGLAGVVNTGTGFILPVPYTNDVIGRMKDFGYSGELLAILEMAQDEVCRRVEFDRDVEPVDHLPTFDW